jgi:hypothetical protein
MIRLGISVEGATEREFVSRVLRRHLADSGVGIVVPIDIGGNVSLDKIRGVLPAILGQFDFASTMYDLYGFKRRHGRGADEIEAEVANLVDEARRARLIPYVQQYEFEALLFAVPEQTCEWLSLEGSACAAMRAAVAEKGSPELVNDGVETSPSHRMRVMFSRYDKKLHGPEILELAGLPAIRAQCPRFDAWVQSLERLGRRAA